VFRPLPIPLITAVSDRRRLSPRDGEACELLVAWAAAVARAGVDIIHLRERDLTDATLAAMVGQIVAATAGTSAVVVVNDRTDIALAAGCAGVHLPASAPPAHVVRRVAPAPFLIGRSVHGGDDPAALAGADCDYVTFGTVFPSASKPAGHRAAGLDALRQACAGTSVPVQAIGGIDLANAADVARAGAAGVAAIGLFLDGWSAGQPDVRLAAIVTQLRLALATAGP
jgi:thiamine-phosphate pyrophosphorylase